MENLQKVLIIVNPISGNIDKTDIVDRIVSVLNEKNIAFEIYKTTGENDHAEIVKILDRQKFDRIFVLGGDGTLKMLAEVLKDETTAVALFPTGSANGLSVNLNIPDNLYSQIDIALGGNKISIDMLKIEDEICLHISDFGLNAELIKNYEASAIRGKMGYLLQSLPTLWESRYPFDFTIKYNDKEIKRSGVFLAFSNAQKYGTGAVVNPNAKMDDGIFEVLIFKDFDVKEILKTLSNEIEFDPNIVEIFPVKEVEVVCHQPVSFQIDGEYCGEKEKVSVKLSTRKLPILIP